MNDLDRAEHRHTITGEGASHPTVDKQESISGTQYASTEFRAALTAHGIRPSMGRTGSCYDNAAAESFFATLKTEIGTRTWTTRRQARRDVFAYLAYYNHHRLHSTLGYRTPHETRLSYPHHHAHAA